jgi:hypothetical protein
VHSPSISKLEIVSRGQVRRAKLYYLRELRGKKARIKERRIDESKLAALQEAAGASASEPDDAADDVDEAADVVAEPVEPVEAAESEAVDPSGDGSDAPLADDAVEEKAEA